MRSSSRRGRLHSTLCLCAWESQESISHSLNYKIVWQTGLWRLSMETSQGEWQNFKFLRKCDVFNLILKTWVVTLMQGCRDTYPSLGRQDDWKIQILNRIYTQSTNSIMLLDSKANKFNNLLIWNKTDIFIYVHIYHSIYICCFEVREFKFPLCCYGHF